MLIRLSLFFLAAVFGGNAAAVEFSAEERALIALHGPWPPRPVIDDSNRASGLEPAIRLGEMLFFEHELGGDSKLSCGSCHDPGLAFADGRETGVGRAKLDRNTPTLLNLGGNRWFGWGGEHDSLWAQSIRPLLALDEMASTPLMVKQVLQGKPRYRQYYRAAFGADIDQEDNETALVNAGKALAAYQETLVSPRGAFDDFRDALIADNRDAMALYPERAQRGLKLFVGEGRCNLCHLGPRFSSGEFADIGIEYFVEGGVDAGRYRGIQRLRSNAYNRLGAYNDGDAAVNALTTRQVRLLQRNWGEFKVPGLRGVQQTAPYMHNGSVATLHDVIRHYSELDEERLHADGEKILRPLRLSPQQIEDLVSFLQTLGEY